MEELPLDLRMFTLAYRPTEISEENWSRSCGVARGIIAISTVTFVLSHVVMSGDFCL